MIYSSSVNQEKTKVAVWSDTQKCSLCLQFKFQTAVHEHKEYSFNNYPPKRWLLLKSESSQHPRVVTKIPYLFNIFIEILQVFSTKLKRVLVFFITSCLTAAAQVGHTGMVKPGDSVFQESNIVKSKLSLISQTETFQSISSSSYPLTQNLTKWLK